MSIDIIVLANYFRKSKCMIETVSCAHRWNVDFIIDDMKCYSLSKIYYKDFVIFLP